MALRHLTDTEIQDYLDENLSQKQTSVLKQYLESCDSCQNELSKYQYLYTGLKNDADINLSPNFSQFLISKIREESTEIFHIAFRDILFSIIGLLIAVGTTLYYVGLKPLAASFNSMLKPQVDNSIAIFSTFKQLLAGLNININLLVFAGLILLIIIALDRILYKYRDKLRSFLKYHQFNTIN